ncbi:MAG TPA: type II toxin-antitoxin system Phd/YefM family antitoxin [Rhodocyclaceae bacterium]|nr:type II toxin-antitoxin system Phd/YefM family antitoxin [Rhodocyclaceae bacterium]
MNIVPAQEIKRRGMVAVDEALSHGPVHVIKNNRPQYVVLTEEDYRELLEARDAVALERIRASLADAAAGRVTHHDSVQDLLRHLDRDAV